MARYKNGTIRPSLPESVSDQLRGVRSGYLVANGVPVTGNYGDAIRDGLRGGFGPPPTPSVGYAATAEYVYPSQKMVTGAALAGQVLRESLKTSYSSPAAEYHSGLRALRGIGGMTATVTVISGDTGESVRQKVASACNATVALSDAMRAVGANAQGTNIKTGTYSIDCDSFSGARTGGGGSSTGSGTPAVRGLPAGLKKVFDGLLASGKLDQEEYNEKTQELVSTEAAALAAYNASGTSAQQRAAYEACIANEADALLYTDFSNCRDRVGAAAAPSGWADFVQGLKDLGSGIVDATSESGKALIEAGIVKLTAAGQPVPQPCLTNRYTAPCAGAVASAVSALDKSQQTPPPAFDRGGGGRSESDNTGLFIGLGIAAVAVVGILAFALSKKSAASAA